jgi:hypothetical protein
VNCMARLGTVKPDGIGAPRGDGWATLRAHDHWGLHMHTESTCQ